MTKIERARYGPLGETWWYRPEIWRKKIDHYAYVVCCYHDEDGTCSVNRRLEGDVLGSEACLTPEAARVLVRSWMLANEDDEEVARWLQLRAAHRMERVL